MDVDRLRSLRKYVFSVPRYYATAVAVVLISILFGLAMRGNYIFSFLVFGLPALLSAAASTAMTRPWSKSLLIRRSMFLSLISMLITAVFFFLPYAFAPSLLLDSLIFGEAMAFALSYFAILSITNINRISCVLPASTQPLFQIGALLALEKLTPGLYFLPETFNPTVALAVFATMAAGVFVYMKVIEAPVKQAFGFGIFDLISSFVDHVTSDSLSMERFFQTIGQSVTVPAAHLVLREADTGKPKGMIIVPYVHPGPLGNLGASNVTKILDDELSAESGCLLVVHGSSTHDMNPTSAQETRKLAQVAREVLSEKDGWLPASTCLQRVQIGTAKLCGQMIDGSLLAINTFSPNPTEDVELGLGLAAMEAGRGAGARQVALVDAHNCFTQSAKAIHAGDQEGYDLVKGVAELARKLSVAETFPIRAGFGVRHREDESIGPLGIRVCAIEVGKQKVAYVVLDANNMAQGLREKIAEKLSGVVDDCEVMTSDNHSVNLVKGDFNPVGASAEGLVEDVLAATQDALGSLSAVTARLDVRMTPSINVFGPGRVSEIVTTLNSMMSMGKGFTAVLIIAVLALCVLIFIVLGSLNF